MNELQELTQRITELEKRLEALEQYRQTQVKSLARLVYRLDELEAEFKPLQTIPPPDDVDEVPLERAYQALRERDQAAIDLAADSAPAEFSDFKPGWRRQQGYTILCGCADSPDDNEDVYFEYDTKRRVIVAWIENEYDSMSLTISVKKLKHIAGAAMAMVKAIEDIGGNEAHE